MRTLNLKPTTMNEEILSRLSAAEPQERCVLCRTPVFIVVGSEINSVRIGDTYRTPQGSVFIGRSDFTEARYCPGCAASIRICRVCGCTEEVACEGGCWWIERDLCSNCEAQQ